MAEVAVVERMRQAMNAHDVEALAGCFAEHYRCEMPLHPSRGFVGRDRVRENWGGLFAHVPDLVARVLRCTQDGDLAWSEWEISGTTVSGARFTTAGVAILSIKDALVDSARFYLDPVDDDSR